MLYSFEAVNKFNHSFLALSYLVAIVFWHSDHEMFKNG